MKNSLDIFHTSITDTLSLLRFITSQTEPTKQEVLFRSSIVLFVASWEQYVEQLAESSVKILLSRLRSSSTIPEGVKQKIAIFSVKENRTNPKTFSDSVWQFSDQGWKQTFLNFCQSSTKALNTASTTNIINLYKNILGIRNVTSNWLYNGLTQNDCIEYLDDLINLRNDISHGVNKRVAELSIETITDKARFLNGVSESIYQSVKNEIDNISSDQALKYSLMQHCFKEIIEVALQTGSDTISLDEIKAIGPSAQGNHNKLLYKPWGLLEYINSSTRRITTRLIDFYNGTLELPCEILVFDNKDSTEALGTRLVHFIDLP